MITLTSLIFSPLGCWEGAELPGSLSEHKSAENSYAPVSRSKFTSFGSCTVLLGKFCHVFEWFLILGYWVKATVTGIIVVNYCAEAIKLSHSQTQTGVWRSAQWKLQLRKKPERKCRSGNLTGLMNFWWKCKFIRICWLVQIFSILYLFTELVKDERQSLLNPGDVPGLKI